MKSRQLPEGRLNGPLQWGGVMATAGQELGCTKEGPGNTGERPWLVGAPTPCWACSYPVCKTGLRQLHKALNHTLKWDCCSVTHTHTHTQNSEVSPSIQLCKQETIQLNTNDNHCAQNMKLTLPSRYRKSKCWVAKSGLVDFRFLFFLIEEDDEAQECRAQSFREEGSILAWPPGSPPSPMSVFCPHCLFYVIPK